MTSSLHEKPDKARGSMGHEVAAKSRNHNSSKKHDFVDTSIAAGNTGFHRAGATRASK